MVELPEIGCPFPVRENPHAADTEQYLRETLDGCGADGRLGGIGIGTLAGLSYPDVEPEALRIAALWFAFFWLFDDAWADRLPPEALAEVGPIHGRVAAILSGATPTQAEHPSLRLLDVLLGAIRAWRPDWDPAHFHREILRYVRATLWEVAVRRAAVVPSLSDYLRMRPLVAAVPPSRELDFLLCDLRLEPVLRDHPVVELADAAAGNYSCWVNDLCSLDTERKSTVNLVVVAGHAFGWPQSRAKEWVAELARDEVATFQFLRRELRSGVLPYTPLCDPARAVAELERYLARYEGWFVASAAWMPTTPRYGATK